MTTEVERLAVLFEANTKQFANAMTKMERQTNTAFKSSIRNSKKFDTALTRNAASARSLAAAFGVGFVAGGLSQLPSVLRQITSEASRIIDVADKVTLTTDALQELRFAAEQTGVAANQSDVAWQRFSRRVAEAGAGSGELLKILKANNIAIKDQNGVIRPTIDLLGDYADLIRNTESEQDKLRLAFLAFDTEGAALVNLLRNGKEGLDDFRQRARDASVVMERELLVQAKAVDDKFNELAATIGTAFKKAVISGIDEVRTMNDQMVELEKSAVKLWQNPSFRNFVEFTAGKGAANALLGKEPLQFTDQSVNRGGKVSLPGAAGGKKTVIPSKDDETTRTNAERDAKRRQKVIDDLKFEAEQLGRTSSARELYNELNRAGVTLNSEQGQQIAALVGQLQEQERATLAAADAQNILGDAALGALEGMIFNGEKASDVIANLAKKLALAAAEAALMGQGPLANIFGTADSGGALGQLFGGFRASGGPVSAGKVFMVGEQGPELFVPGRSGQIVSNAAMRGGGGTTVVQHNTFNAGMNRVDRAWVEARMAQSERRVRAAVPGDLRRRQGARSDAVLQR